MTSEVPTSTPPPRSSVFLSYASADRAAARALRDTLASAGLEVWLDEEELGGGEAWDAKIRNQIRTCTYFMPVISATTEIRREGYFRREWRFAVERTLDLADDVLFLVPVVIDSTRDSGARVPEKFFTVQWLRAPGGAVTPELRELAGKLATGDAVAHPPVAVDIPASRADGKARKPEKAVPPFPDFPPFPEPGHRLRFIYNLVLWGGRMLHVFWLHLPRFIRVIAAIVIVFNLIAWAFREGDRPPGPKPENQFVPADIAKDIAAASQQGDGQQAAAAIKSLVGGVAHALQTGRPLAVVNFGGVNEEAATYADRVFSETIQLLQQTPNQTSVSPIPLEPDDDDDDALARGTKLESQFVLTGFAQRGGAGAPLLFTAKLYHVKQRTVLWSETFDSAQVDAATTARRVAEAVRLRALPAAQP